MFNVNAPRTYQLFLTIISFETILELLMVGKTMDVVFLILSITVTFIFSDWL